MCNLKTTLAPGIEYRFVYKCPCAKGDQHYLDLDKCLDEKPTHKTIQCERRIGIFKEVIRKRFCCEVTTQRHSGMNLFYDISFTGFTVVVFCVETYTAFYFVLKPIYSIQHELRE